MRYFVIFAALLLVTLSSSAQTKDSFVVLTDLTSDPPCGIEEKPRFETITGVVMRREFDEDELTLRGVVIRQAGDQRRYVNIDSEFLKSSTGTLTADLSDVLRVGRRVKLKTDVCGRTLTLRRVFPAPTAKSK